MRPRDEAGGTYKEGSMIALVALGAVWCVIVFLSSLAIHDLFGSAAQLLFLLPVFIVSVVGGAWFGSR